MYKSVFGSGEPSPRKRRLFADSSSACCCSAAVVDSPALGRKPVSPLIGDGMVQRRVVVRAKDVVFLKAVLEAHEGLAQVFAEGGGDLTIAAPLGREEELDFVLDALLSEVSGYRA
jgi:hypothetical protein